MSLIAKSYTSLLSAILRARMYSNGHGFGGGKDGGCGCDGSIRAAGGAFGKLGTAREEEFFYKKQKEQIADLKGHLDKEIAFHQEQIQEHKEAIRRQKELIDNIEKK